MFISQSAFRMFSWALYDLSNTIFSAIVVTVYLPLYITDLTGIHTSLGASATVSMIFSGVFVPVFGALSDSTGGTKRYLILTTLLTVFFTLLLSTRTSSVLTLVFFMAANFLYHSSLVFYNSLLPLVAPPERQGFASGLGSGLGYLGVIFALPCAHWVDQSIGRPYVFIVAGSLFFIFSIPLFLFVPERSVENARRFHLSMVRESFAKIKTTLAQIRGKKNILYFLIGNFFVVDALNAIILWLSVYMKNALSIPQEALIRTLVALNFSAFLCGLLLGKITDRFGAKPTLLISIVSLAIAISVTGISKNVPLFTFTLLIFGALAASGIWTAGRKLLIELSPKERIGEFFGLYGFTTKLSAIGAVTFSFLADLMGYRIAVLSQLVTTLLGAFFIARVNSPGGLHTTNRRIEDPGSCACNPPQDPPQNATP